MIDLLTSFIPSTEVVLYIGAIGLLVIGISGLLLLRNAFRLLLALVIFEAGANLFLVLSGFIEKGVAPIISGSTNAANIMVDPVPQALVLTAIVIGVGIQALALSIIFKVKEHYGSLDMQVIRSKLEDDIAQHTGVIAPASHETPKKMKQNSSLDSNKTGEVL